MGHRTRTSIVLRATLSMLLFSLFLKMDVLLRAGDAFVGWGWSAIPVLLGVLLVRMAFAGLAVLAVLPLVLGYRGARDWLPRYLRLDRKSVLLGLLSFLAFCFLATVISLGVGVFRGDLSAVLARPDLRPDPDVIGWGYFLLALVPGIWEELAFRGLIQSQLRKGFSTTVSILLSAALFSLFHFSNLLSQAPGQAIGGVIMALFFGIAWGVMTARTASVIPAMVAHYLVDSVGQIFLSVDSSKPASATIFFLLLTLAYPVVSIVLTRVRPTKAMHRDTPPAA